MNNFLNFFASGKNSPVQGEKGLFYRRHHVNKPVHVAMFSDFFGNAPANGFCTNIMYAKLKDSLINSVNIYNTNASIIVDVLEKTPSDEQTRELLLIGFRRYLKAYYQKLHSKCLYQLMLMVIFFCVGVTLAYVNKGLNLPYPEWLHFVFEVVSFGMIWQLAGWFAFEFPSIKRNINRHKQLLHLEYSFKQWE